MADARSDEELMTAVAAGNFEAFGVLVERHHQRVVNIAYGMSGQADAARDVAQETFIRILKHAPLYVPSARFTTFLYTVVRSVVVETGRKRARRREVSLDHAAPAAPDRTDRAAERGELRARLAEALAELPDELRDAFVLSEIEGLRYRDIAEICGCPEGTVASRKHQAVERLRRSLSAFHPGSER